MTPCTRCRGQIEEGDLRCPICALPVPVAMPAPAEATSGRQLHERARVLRCTECSAAVAFSPAVQAPHCAFCGSVMAIEQPIDPVEAATLRLPLGVDRVRATAALRTWLGSRGWFSPAALHEDAVLESLTPIAWAGWVVSAHATVAWTADSDHGARRSAWAPHAGKVPMRFDAIVIPASRGLTLAECQRLVPYYDLAWRVAVEAPLEHDETRAPVEAFDVQRSTGRRAIQRAIEATARTRVEAHIPGRRFRNVHVACLLDAQTTERIALPAWVMAYRYQGRPYRAIVHGQRPEIVLGSAPVDWRKVAAVVGGALLVAAVIAYALLRTGG